MQSSKKKTVSVRDKLDGNEIDLSLLELTDVPVRELVSFESKYLVTRVVINCTPFLCFFYLNRPRLREERN